MTQKFSHHNSTSTNKPHYKCVSTCKLHNLAIHTEYAINAPRHYITEFIVSLTLVLANTCFLIFYFAITII